MFWSANFAHRNKVVADGGVSFFLDHFVTARVSRYAYGTKCSWVYDDNNAGHVLRKDKCIPEIGSGQPILPGAFATGLQKVNTLARATSATCHLLSESTGRGKRNLPP